MGKKKFDRNVEISAPILNPELIKVIHSPPKGQRLDLKHGGFKTLLADLNSQDSTDEVMPLNENHVPSYIGISCAVSGYSSYSSYSRSRVSPLRSELASATRGGEAINRARTMSPSGRDARSSRLDQHHHHQQQQQQVNHITIDKDTIQSPDHERRELTQKLTASASERSARSPSPHITPTEDDRHHGAYVGARYCPMPRPGAEPGSQRRIPLLGIDDTDTDNRDSEGAGSGPREPHISEPEEHKVEQKIACLYGDQFVDGWRESQSHKVKKELEQAEPPAGQHSAPTTGPKSPKDLVTLRPTPQPAPAAIDKPQPEEQLSAAELSELAHAKVLASVEPQFLSRLLSDDNPPSPAKAEAAAAARAQRPSPPLSPINRQGRSQDTTPDSSPAKTTATTTGEELDKRPLAASPMSADQQAAQAEEQEEHIEYQIRASSPLDNQSSPVRLSGSSVALDEQPALGESLGGGAAAAERAPAEEHKNLVSFSPEPSADHSCQLSEHGQPQQTQVDAAQFVLGQLALEPQLVEQATSHSYHEDVHVDGAEDAKNDNNDNNNDDNDDNDDELRDKDTKRDSQPQQEALQTQLEPAGAHADALLAGGQDVAELDGRYYLNLLDEERDFISARAAEAQRVLSRREGQQGAGGGGGGDQQDATANDNNDDETVGRLRAAIGKAHLLTAKKFEQFRQLCEANINKSDEQQFATLNGDLAGFWDMLQIQVRDVRQAFIELEAVN